MGNFLRATSRKLWRLIQKRRRCIGIVLGFNGCLWGIPALYIALFTPPASEIKLPSIQQLQQSQYDVYVVNWGFHTAIIVEQPQGWTLGPPNHPQAPYIEYGWGDKQFFMLSDTSIPTTLAAAILPTPSVVYLRGRDAPPTAENYARQLYHRLISRQQLYALIGTLEQSFQRSPQGNRVKPYPQVPEFVGYFYPGREYYIIWSDCNAWTIKHLHRINIAKSDIPVIFSEQVGSSLEGFQLIQDSP
ncbi:MAG: DUF2459 domain-containing protein [Acaryochloridaceae cyanobacterium CSU_3_4]|nr:DUF2459 domain-containing protein [Acaryochloris sp. SU_5_25]NJN38639.1 DUF2459 domain-containing protein [Acaryochloridaceae cyanobacterium CSU_3_4]